MRKEKTKYKLLNAKHSRGITLVALIITIIVLLILAVVSIGAIKNSKIISHSQNAADEWKQAQEEENKLLENYLEQIESSLPGGAEGKTPISTTDTYIGYYADVDDDGTVDGIIYADLAVDGSGQWSDSNGAYSYSKKDTLNNYYISQESYQYKEFKANPVLSPIDPVKDTVEANDRFYIMALENFTTDDYTTFYWYYNARGNMSDYASTTSTDFGKGKQNTATMMTKEYGAGLKDRDIWKYINSEVEKGWFIPSRGEWGAFGAFVTSEEQGLTTSNYSDYGLSNYCWSSSQYDTTNAWYAYFYYGYMSSSLVSNGNFVRLSTTF